jgi:hypothetical protein
MIVGKFPRKALEARTGSTRRCGNRTYTVAPSPHPQKLPERVGIPTREALVVASTFVRAFPEQSITATK